MSVLSELLKISTNGKLRLDRITERSVAPRQDNFWDSGSTNDFDISLVSNNNNRYYIFEDDGGTGVTRIRFKKKCFFMIMFHFNQSTASGHTVYLKDSSDTVIARHETTQANADWHAVLHLNYIANVGDYVYFEANVAVHATRTGALELVAVGYL